MTVTAHTTLSEFSGLVRDRIATVDPFLRSGTVSEVRSDAVKVRDLLVGVGHPVCFASGVGGRLSPLLKRTWSWPWINPLMV